MTDRARYEVVWSGPDVNWESTTFTMLRSDPTPRKAAREHVARETGVSVDNIELAVLEPLDGDTGAQRADELSADPPGKAPPAATTDLEQEDVHRALLADDADRHGHLDPYAGVYRGLAVAVAGARAHSDELATVEMDAAADAVTDRWTQMLAAIRTTVLEQEEHAVRWTIDPYDEMDHRPD